MTKPRAADRGQLEDERAQGRWARPGAAPCASGAGGMSAGASGLPAGDPAGRGRRGAAGSAVALGGQDCHGCASRRPYRRYRGADAGRSRLPLCDRRPFRAARPAWRNDALVRAKAEAALAAGLIANRLPGRNRGRARPGRGAGRGGAPARWLAAGKGVSRPIRWSPMSRSGRSAPGARPPAPTSWRCMVISGGSLPKRCERGRRLSSALWRLGQTGQCRRNPGSADVDGALVGGASLKAEDFLAIARSLPAM